MIFLIASEIYVKQLNVSYRQLFISYINKSLCCKINFILSKFNKLKPQLCTKIVRTVDILMAN